MTKTKEERKHNVVQQIIFVTEIRWLLCEIEPSISTYLYYFLWQMHSEMVIKRMKQTNKLFNNEHCTYVYERRRMIYKYQFFGSLTRKFNEFIQKKWSSSK